MARLDRIAPVKEIAQIGAVIGREFSHELLAAVSPLSEDELSFALDQLVTAELVFRRGTPPEATYSFKHALVQDAAYQSLLKTKRQQLHAHIAQVLEGSSRTTAETQPEVLAQHFTDAGLGETGRRLLAAAGRAGAPRVGQPRKRSPISARGLELIETLPADAQNEFDEEFALQIAHRGSR